jgi:hypothetical protein
MRAKKTLFVRACSNTFPISSASLLVDKNRSVIFPLVDRFARTSSEASRIRAVVANSRQIKHPRLVRYLYILASLDLGAHFVLSQIGILKVKLAGNESDDFLTVLGCFKNGLSFIRVAVPRLRAEFVQQSHIPAQRIKSPGLGLDIVPPHVFLPFAGGPSIFAGHRAGLAGDTLVRIKDPSHLLVGTTLRIKVIHLTI